MYPDKGVRLKHQLQIIYIDIQYGIMQYGNSESVFSFEVNKNKNWYGQEYESIDI